MPRIPLLLPLVLAACATVPPPPAAAPEPPPPPPALDPGPPPPAAGTSVWNRDPGARLRGEAAVAVLPFFFLRLEVLEADGEELRVRCVHCPGAPEGWIGVEEVVHRPLEPRLAAGLGLADFALALREAALRRDVEALRPVMARDFSHQLGPVEPGLLETLAAWEREGYRALDRLPFLLDRGVASVPGSPVWAAPPEHGATLLYRDLRAGFRRGADGWEWVFLVRDRV